MKSVAPVDSRTEMQGAGSLDSSGAAVKTLKSGTRLGAKVNRESFVTMMKGRILDARPRILAERAKIVTEVYRDNPGLPIEILRARVFERTMEELPVHIRDGEMIVGVEGENPGDAQFYPEFSVEWLPEEIEGFESRKDNSRFFVSSQVKEEVRQIAPYWQGRTVASWVKARMPEDTRRVVTENIMASVTGLHHDMGNVLPGYQRILKEGFSGILEKLKENLRKVDLTSPDGISKKLFYESAIIVYEAGIKFAHRYSEKAKELCEGEKDPHRRQELKKIGEICRWVPEYPARTFHEAIQAFWFTHLLVLL